MAYLLRVYFSFYTLLIQINIGWRFSRINVPDQSVIPGKIGKWIFFGFNPESDGFRVNSSASI